MTPRERSRLAVVLLVLAVLAFFVVLLRAGSSSAVHANERPSSSRRVVGYGQIRYAGAGPERWAFRYRRARRALAAARLELRAQRRELLATPSVAEAIDLAAATFGARLLLWDRARCETGGTFDPRALNRSSSAAGLFQFIPSTWRSTPYARFDVLSPYANALAAGWMNAHGRGGEWVCQ